MKIRFDIQGLDCGNCATELERAILKIDGVKNVTINFMMQRMELEYDEIGKEDMIKLVKKVIKKNEPDVEIIEL